MEERSNDVVSLRGCGCRTGAGRFAVSHQTEEFLKLVGLPNALEKTASVEGAGTNRSRPPFASGRRGGRQAPPQPQRGVPVAQPSSSGTHRTLRALVCPMGHNPSLQTQAQPVRIEAQARDGQGTSGCNHDMMLLYWHDLAAKQSELRSPSWLHGTGHFAQHTGGSQQHGAVDEGQGKDAEASGVRRFTPSPCTLPVDRQVPRTR